MFWRATSHPLCPAGSGSAAAESPSTPQQWSFTMPPMCPSAPAWLLMSATRLRPPNERGSAPAEDTARQAFSRSVSLVHPLACAARQSMGVLPDLRHEDGSTPADLMPATTQAVNSSDEDEPRSANPPSDCCLPLR